MDDKDKIVDFEKYCRKCKYYAKSESDDPCWSCLENPVNVNSQKPVYFKEKEGNK